MHRNTRLYQKVKVELVFSQSVNAGVVRGPNGLRSLAMCTSLV